MVPHSFIAKKQAEYLRKLKEELGENYSFVIQEAVQAEYFSKKQCTIHPFCIYYKENGELKNKSLIIISEDTDHYFSQVYLFKRKLVDYLKEKFKRIAKIFFFSDGAPMQYKNKKNFFDLCQMKMNGIETEWAFFATAHGLFQNFPIHYLKCINEIFSLYIFIGKGPCDAIGGTFKRNAMRASLQRLDGNQITNPTELYEWAISKESNVDFIFCTMADHRAGKVPALYNNIRQVPETRKQHSFKPIDDKTVETRKFSFSTDFALTELL